MTISPFQRPRIPRWVVIIVVSLIVLFTFGRGVATFLTDLWWFDSVGATDVLWTGLRAQAALAIGFGLLAIIIVTLNLTIAIRLAPEATLFRAEDPLGRARAQVLPYLKRIVLGIAAFIGLVAGLGMTAAWRSFLLAGNAVDVGRVDPVFGKDVGYYLFSLPFQRAVTTWAFSVLLVTLLVTALAHLFFGGIRPEAPSGRRVASGVRAHLSVLAGLIVLVQAAIYKLDQYELLFSSRGQVTGASYTDVNAELPALKLLVIIALVCALLFFINARVRNLALPASGLALLILTAVVAGGIYPAVVQRFRVTPNELEKERTFIERNLEATRFGFGLDDVTLTNSDGGEASAGDVEGNPETMSNVRLWNPTVLHDVFLNQQRVTQFYEFADVDVDRYEVEGQRRLVMLSARELALAGLPAAARTWLNEHLVYTHGYGVVASRVDRVTGEGLPAFIARDVPNVTSQGMPEVTQPRIYFGELEDQAFAVVGGDQGELDYPLGAGDTTAENTYEGSGGVPMGSLFRRAMFAWRFGDVNLLISGAIDSDARILFNRQVTERVQKVLPFAELDRDPYITVIDGRLTWIIDGYTTTENLPYSERLDFDELTTMLPGHGNYIRNSLKITVDAEDGTITPYAWDETDPMLRAWRSAYPGIVQARAEMPEGVLEHVRYPEGLFEAQTELWSTYHIETADDFYSKQDAWRVAGDPTGASSDGATFPRVPAYYVLMKLPGDDRATFSLVRPFTPNRRPNLTGYMVAKADAGDSYGELVTYRFQSDDVVGPEQVHSRIGSDPVISPKLTLLGQQGSTVIRGNLLIVPVNDSLLYVQPIYVRGAGSNLPELKFVAVVSGETIKAAPTLAEALRQVFGAPTPGPDVDPDPGPGPSADVLALLEEALEADAAAQEALRSGDFAEYGRQQERERNLLERAAQAAREG
jgi:uncharacterized membrane protein (UPF0182 family)